jgi:hypothetical protein
VLLPELLLRMEVLDTADVGPVRREYVRVSVVRDGERDATEAEGGVEQAELKELLLKRLVWLNTGFGIGRTSSSFTGGSGTPWSSLLSARYRLDCEGKDWSYFAVRKEASLAAGENPIDGDKREDREYVDDIAGRSANSVSRCLR